MSACRRRTPGPVAAGYAILAVLLVGYIASLILRQPRDSWPLIDSWGVAAFELVAGGLCVARALGPRQGRAIPITLGSALIAWSIGDGLLALESAGGVSPIAPSPADVFYLTFYPLLFAAVVLLARKRAGRLASVTWLDGAVAGLGAAAVCACFAFSTIMKSTGGSPLAVATNLAYPLGDVLLLALVVGSTAVLPGRRNAQWLMLAGAIALNAVGDTDNLFASTIGTTGVGTLFNAFAWPTAILLMSLSVWLPPARLDPLSQQRAPGFLLPGLGSSAGMVVLFVAAVHHVGPMALGLATATLLTVGARMGLSVRRLRALTEERHRQAVTDELTSLGNRRQLFTLLDAHFLDQADPRNPHREVAFLFIDLDHFKEINDSFGHSAGDELLRQLGPRLAGALRRSDVLVRVGGDELGVLVIDAGPAYAEKVADRVMALLEQPFVIQGVTVRIGASIGIASAPTDATDAAGLLRCADVAMYRAKLRPSSHAVFQHDVDDRGDWLRLVHELRTAIDEGELLLNYQVQADVGTGEILGVEALLRWPHPRLGLVSPLTFLPLAEEAGLMQPLTAWVLDRALAQGAAWRAAGRQLTVSVNASVTNLVDAGFVADVRDALARHRLDAESLTIEITETTVISDFDRSRAAIAQLRELGCGVSIDDFGAGFTSLAYLGSLDVTELKLDRTFIEGLASDPAAREQLVGATIDLGHSLGLRVIAEGIEDEATLDMLRRGACDQAQGYLIGRPTSAADIVFEPMVGHRRTAAGVLRAS